jgi:hypothetical protein
MAWSGSRSRSTKQQPPLGALAHPCSVVYRPHPSWGSRSNLALQFLVNFHTVTVGVQEVGEPPRDPVVCLTSAPPDSSDSGLGDSPRKPTFQTTTVASVLHPAVRRTAPVLPDSNAICLFRLRPDRDCSVGEFCSGETICPCGTDCPDPDVPGTRVALPTGCCNTVTDCGNGEVCFGADDVVLGRCLPAAGSGECWTGEERGSASLGACWWCTGSSFCPCVEACPSCVLDCPANNTGRCQYLDPCL